MPMYEFRCNKCGGTFEELVFASDETVPCPLTDPFSPYPPSF